MSSPCGEGSKLLNMGQQPVLVRWVPKLVPRDRTESLGVVLHL